MFPSIQKLFSACVFITILAGCSTPPARPPAVVPVTPQMDTQHRKTPPMRRPTGKIRQSAPPTAPAAMKLLGEARSDYSNGRIRSALAKLERAQRISPRSAKVYQAFGEAYVSTGQSARAEQFFLKAISLSGSDRSLRRVLWSQIAEVRDQLGNDAGAMQARKKAGE